MSIQRLGVIVDDVFRERTLTHTTASVGTTSVVALAANDDRLYAKFVNDSDTIVYLNIGGTAVANKGVRLNANGGEFEMYVGKNLGRGTVSAISSAASKNLLVLEGE